MNIDDILKIIGDTAKANDISTPFLVGGVPRDRVLGERGSKSDIQDLDITTGDKDSAKLAVLVSERIPESHYRIYDDGHSSITVMGLHIDFSSHFTAPGINNELRKKNIQDITQMKLEIYSRDFTMNTLLESLDFTSIYDITGEGIKDIQAKIIKCPIDPNITIGVDPRRILRAIKFSIKYNFVIDDDLRRAMLDHRKKIQSLPPKFVQDKMAEIVRLDADKGIEKLIEFKLLPLVDLPKSIYDVLIQKRQLVRAL